MKITFLITALAAYAASNTVDRNCACLSDDAVTYRINETVTEMKKSSFRPRDCFDIKHSNPKSKSGIYRIYPTYNRPEGFRVLCDMRTDGGGWIVFQNRYNGKQDFFKDWESYVQGFGKIEEEFWLGLELLHELTRYGKYTLRIDMSDWNDIQAYATYKKFYVGDSSGYILNYSKNSYFGDAGDGLTVRSYQMKFTTKNRDQDVTDYNCAEKFKGAWWYRDCHYSNLNGLYIKGETDQFATGMVWEPFRGFYYGLKTSQMKFRPDYIEG